jgi:hypothetical protein
MLYLVWTDICPQFVFLQPHMHKALLEILYLGVSSLG